MYSLEPSKKRRLSSVTEMLEPLCELRQDDPKCPLPPVSTNGVSGTPTSPVNIKREGTSVSLYTTPTYLPEVPYQPDDVPPYYDRRRHHLFQKKWFKEYPWLHFDPESKGVYCFQCLSAVIKGGFEAPPNNIFARGGFRNWKKGVERFRVHDNSQLHKDTVEYSVSRLLGIKANCAGLEVIISSLRFLIGVGYESNSSKLTELLELRRLDTPVLEEHLSKTVFSQQDEKELIQIMATFTLRTVCQRISNDRLFGVTLETVPTPEGRMIAVTVRTSKMLRESEHFIGLYPLDHSTLDDLALLLSFENLIVFACKSPDLKQLEKTLEERYPSALNMSPLARNLFQEVQDSLSHIRGIGHSLSMIHLLMQVFSNSDPEFLEYVYSDKQLKTVDFKAVHSTLKNYASIAKKIRDLSETPPWTLLPSLLIKLMEKTETLFNLLLCRVFFYPIESLSNLLQKSESIKGLKEAVSSIVAIFDTYKSDEDFNSFWDKYVKTCKNVGVWNDEEEKNGIELKKKLYFEALEAVDGVLRRLLGIFDGKGFADLVALENAFVSREDIEGELLKATSLPSVLDVKVENMIMEKQMLVKMMDKDGNRLSLRTCLNKLRSMERETTRLFPELVELAVLLVIAQITSRLGSIDNFLASTKSTDLIHELSLLHAYQNDPSILCNKDIAEAFIARDPSKFEALL